MSHVSNTFRGVVGLVLLLSLGCSAMQRTIMRDEAGYKVFDKGRWNQHHNYDVDTTLRKMNVQQLRKFLAAGCSVRTSRLSNGDYVLRGHVPGKGGGPLTGLAMYWATKAACYGTAVAAAGTVVAATGGAAGAVTGALVAGATTGASAGATVAAGAIAGAGYSAAAVEATAAVVTSAGSLAAAAAAVEAASIAVGGFFAAIPFLP